MTNLNNFKKVLEAFKQGEPLSASRDSSSTYVSTGELLLIRQFQQEYRYNSQGKNLKAYVLGLKTKTEVIGNSSIVPVEKENGRSNDSVLDEQLIMSDSVTMIPFSVLKEAGLSLYTFKEVARGSEETLMRKVERLMTQVAYDKLDQKLVISCEELTEKSAFYRADSSMKFNVEYYEKQHFTGPRLFQCSSNDKKEVSTYLLDVDRNELPHGLINPFLVKLSDSTVTSVQEAYESLKPSEVIQAEEKELKVLRQGEWFFIETTVDASFLNKTLEKQAEERKKANRWSDGKRGELRAGRNRPNTVQFFVEINGSYFIKGTVSHTGREHKDIDLKGWYQALPNTATESWTISGNID